MPPSMRQCLIALLALGIFPDALPSTAAPVAIPFPSAQTPQPLDVGTLDTLSGKTAISVTVALNLADVDIAEKLLKAVSTPGNPQYHHFLTAEQFVARFAPAKSDVAKVIASLEKYGLTVEQTTATTLRVTGLPANIEHAFAVSLRSYEVPAHGAALGYRFHAPMGHATIPAEIASAVAAVAGLDSGPHLRPFHLSTPAKLARNPQPKGPLTTISPFGLLTVTDFASLYDVQPLYSQGVTGKGRTIGVMSLANFTPSDVFAYWSALGLSVNPKRLQVVLVDGGPGAPSDAAGSLETTLDVEQSGGIAPGANMIVYLAPNTNQAFIDVFAAAIDANKADTLSISWGTWEWFDNLENAPVTDPFTGKTVSTTQALHELLLRAALQGQTVIAASGDGGAYDINNDLGCIGPYSKSQPFSCSRALTVDYPASDPAITAGGGTTLPGKQDFCLNLACTPPYYVVKIAHERVWGWDYLKGLCSALELTVAECGIFPSGSGGGVSITFSKPLYQWGLPGTQLSQPHQLFQAGSGFAADDIGLYYALPALYPGRNVPDVSFNADPETGYVVYYTSDVSGFGEEPGWGGTSFVAPQLNGVSSLLGQYVHGRLGLLNYALYFAQGRRGPATPLDPIAYGDNWFYFGSDGYNLGAGLGTMDVANFAEFLRDPL